MNGRVLRFGRILHALAYEAKDAKQVADEIGAATVATRVTMGRMGALGLLHEVVPPSRMSLAKWRLGPGPASSRQASRRLTPGKAGVSLIHFAALIRCIQAGPQSVHDIVRLTGQHINSVRSQMSALRAAHVAYRSEWHREREAGEWCAHWQFGIDRPDKSKPRAVPERELRARYKANRRERESTLQIVHALAANSTHFTEAA